MVTITYGLVSLPGSRTKPSTYLKAYGHWFNRIAMEAYGNNHGRKIRFQPPLSYAFVDYDDSRRSKRISNGDLRHYESIHIHAVIALRPNGQECRRPLLVAGSAHQLEKYGDVRIEPFDPNHLSLENMIAYCSKGARAVDDGDPLDEMWDCFPIRREKADRQNVVARTVRDMSKIVSP